MDGGRSTRFSWTVSLGACATAEQLVRMGRQHPGRGMRRVACKSAVQVHVCSSRRTYHCWLHLRNGCQAGWEAETFVNYTSYGMAAY